jgi:hypothetical protein
MDDVEEFFQRNCQRKQKYCAQMILFLANPTLPSKIQTRFCSSQNNLVQ